MNNKSKIEKVIEMNAVIIRKRKDSDKFIFFFKNKNRTPNSLPKLVNKRIKEE